MKIHSRLFRVMLIGASLGISCNTSAEIVGTDAFASAFLYGDNIEVGIGADGAFGSDVKSTKGKSNNSYLGFITFPTGGANRYTGDFVLQSGPTDEEGWGVGFDGKAYNNNNTTAPEIQGQLEIGSFKETETLSPDLRPTKSMMTAPDRRTKKRQIRGHKEEDGQGERKDGERAEREERE